MTEDRKIEPLAIQSMRIEQDALYSAKTQFEAARIWSTVHLWLGIPTALIAGISGISTFQDQSLVGGALAILAAALASVTTFLNPSGQSAQHHAAGTKYNSLKNRASIFREVDLNSDSPIEVNTATLKRLGQERDDLNETSPQASRRAYERARASIEAGEATYDVDKQKPVT